MATPRTTGRWGRLTVGWVLLVLGLAALVLPGPGLLMVAAGLAILSQQYLWARRRLAPIRARALQAAEASVRSWLSITISVLLALGGVAAGVILGIRPDVPGWWPFAERWWLPGGWATGSSMIGSGCIALSLIAVSYWHFRGSESQRPNSARTGPDSARTGPDSADRLPAATAGRSSTGIRPEETT